MRIALFTEVFLPKIDGITNRLDHTIRCLGELGHEVVVFAPEDAVERHEGAPVIRVPGVSFPPYPGLKISAPDPRIAWELAHFRADVVHAVGPACLGIWGVAAARALGLPVVASYHTDLPRYLPGYGLQWLAPAIWPLLRAIHNRAHVNLCPSRFTRDELHAHGVEPVGIWRGGVDTELFHPEQRRAGMRARLAGGWPTGPILLYVGRLSPEKRLDTLEPALDAIPGANLAIVGDGPARADLEQQYAGRPVSFLGFLRGEELASAFASADLFVMPSTTETLGFVTLEAMASGLPVVAAHAGGILDVVEHGETGLLYDPDQPLQAAARAREILEDDVLRHYLATQARKRAEEASWLSETRKLVLEYRRARLLRAERSVLRRAYDAVV